MGLLESDQSSQAIHKLHSELQLCSAQIEQQCFCEVLETARTFRLTSTSLKQLTGNTGIAHDLSLSLSLFVSLSDAEVSF